MTEHEAHLEAIAQSAYSLPLPRPNCDEIFAALSEAVRPAPSGSMF